MAAGWLQRHHAHTVSASAPMHACRCMRLCVGARAHTNTCEHICKQIPPILGGTRFGLALRPTHRPLFKKKIHTCFCECKGHGEVHAHIRWCTHAYMHTRPHSSLARTLAYTHNRTLERIHALTTACTRVGTRTQARVPAHTVMHASRPKVQCRRQRFAAAEQRSTSTCVFSLLSCMCVR